MLLGVQGENNEMGVNFTSGGTASGGNAITIENGVAGAVDYQNGSVDRKILTPSQTINKKRLLIGNGITLIHSKLCR